MRIHARIRTRIIVVLAGLIASGCTVLFGLDEHAATTPNPGDETGTDSSVLPDGGKPPTDSSDLDVRNDVDGAPVGCGTGVPFRNPKGIPGLAFNANQHSARSLSDGKTVYITSERFLDGVPAGSHVFMASTDTSGSFVDVHAPPGNNVNSSGLQRHAVTTNDDFHLFYIQLNGGAQGEIWHADRDAATAFHSIGYLQGIPRGTDYSDVYVTPDGARLYTSKGAGNPDIYESEFNGTQYGQLKPIAGVNSTAEEYAPVVTPNYQTMFFARVENQQLRTYVATRATGTTFSNITEVCGLGTPNDNTYPTWISPNGRTLYYVKYPKPDGKRELWQAERAD